MFYSKLSNVRVSAGSKELPVFNKGFNISDIKKNISKSYLWGLHTPLSKNCVQHNNNIKTSPKQGTIQISCIQ